MPLHLVLGAQDGCLLPAMADGQDEVFSAPHQVTVPDGVGHIPHLEAAKAITKIVLPELA